MKSSVCGAVEGCGLRLGLISDKIHRALILTLKVDVLYPTRGISERGHICSAHRLYIYFFFIGGEVHARMRCRSSNQHRARHAATSQILHSRNRFPKNMSALTQNYAVHTLFHIEIALQGATSIPAAHPTPSAVNNSDFPSTPSCQNAQLRFAESRTVSPTLHPSPFPVRLTFRGG